jgi:hypothetical protein
MAQSPHAAIAVRAVRMAPVVRVTQIERLTLSQAEHVMIAHALRRDVAAETGLAARAERVRSVVTSPPHPATDLTRAANRRFST